MARSEETVLMEKRSQIGYITWNRPEKLNAIRPLEYRLFDDKVNDCERDDDIRAVIITGKGRAWTVGDDFSFYPGQEEREKLLEADPDFKLLMEGKVLEIELHHRLFIPQSTVMTMYNSGKVWIGAINGLCWQSEILCGMDFVIAADVARFAIGDVRMGSCPGGTSTQLLPRLVGLRRAIELILMSEEISAQDAYRIGLVNKVVPLAQLMPEAEALAKKIIAHPSIGVTLAKLAIHKAWVLPLEDGLDLERTYGALAMQTEETRSFTQDFLAKKKYAKGK